MAKPVLLHCPQMAGMAERIKVILGDQIEVGVIDWKSFPRGWPDTKVLSARELNGCKSVFLASFDTPVDMFAQFSVIRAMPFFTGENILTVLPCFPTARKDRAVHYGEIVTFKTLVEILGESMPKYVKHELAMYDIHTKPGIHAFGNFVRPRYLSALPLLRERILKLGDYIAIGFPDEGAWKRFEDERELFSGFPFIRCGKDRIEGEVDEVRILAGNPAGRHVVLVDDLIESGTTARKVGSLLLQKGAVDVSLYATHGTFAGETWKSLAGIFRHIWITDSCPYAVEAMRGLDRFEVISLASDIARSIMEICL